MLLAYVKDLEILTSIVDSDVYIFFVAFPFDDTPIDLIMIYARGEARFIMNVRRSMCHSSACKLLVPID